MRESCTSTLAQHLPRQHESSSLSFSAVRRKGMRQGARCRSLGVRCMLLIGIWNLSLGMAFSSPATMVSMRQSALYKSKDQSIDDLLGQAESLRREADELRASLPPSERLDEKKIRSPWLVPGEAEEGSVDYRFYMDLGREDGSWMEPRWAASGRRVEFALDLRLTRTKSEDQSILPQMDNLAGSTSPVYDVDVAPYARLNNGFDRIACLSSAYRIDGAAPKQTIRLMLVLDAISYGDLKLDKGPLFISLPMFGLENLSRKEGPVSVRQYGWHTGWRRLESRIVGVARTKPVSEARRIDGY